MSNPENIVSLFVLLGVAGVTSHFASRARNQADLAGTSARQNAAIAGFSRQLTAARNEEEMMQAICAEVSRLFDVRTAFLSPSAEGPLLRAAFPPENRLATIELAAAQWTLEKGRPAGRGSDTLAASDWLFYPIGTADRTMATIGLARDDGRQAIRSDQLQLLMSLIDQTSLVLDRMQMETEMRDLSGLRERDRLRAALLSSVSHDLRTPLTSILVAVSEMKRTTSSEFLNTIDVESGRLNRFVSNLLDMARVEAGALHLNTQITDLTDAVASAVHDTRDALQGHTIKLEIPIDLPLVRIDPQLFHHCLLNLLDNAGRYADRATPITIAGRMRGKDLTLSVQDEGAGLPVGREHEVFETFKRLEGSDRVKAGTGLGLAIVKGFAEAMGLRVDASNRGSPQGASFDLHFPENLLVIPIEEGAADE